MRIFPKEQSKASKNRGSLKLRIIFIIGFLLLLALINLNIVEDNQYPLLTKVLKTEAVSNKEKYRNWFHALNSPIDRLTIDIKFRDWQKLVEKRNEAMERRLLLQTEDSFVPAELRINEASSIRIKLRLKGARRDHYNSDKWSFRIHIKDKDKYFKGMNRFSLQSPHTRGYHFEPLYADHIQREGLLAFRYDFIDLTVNGNHIGVMAVEEAVAKQLLESQHMREGVIFEFEKKQSVQYAVANQTSHYNWRKAPINVFQEKKLQQSETLKHHANLGKQMLKGMQEGFLPPSQVLDVPKIARFLAIATLWSSWHAVEWEDIRFYLNPITFRFEPIVSEAALQMADLIPGGPLYDYFTRSSLSYSLLSDPYIRSAYIEELQRITKAEYIDSLVNYLKAKEKVYLSKLHKEYTDLPRFNPVYLEEKADLFANLNQGNFDSLKWFPGVDHRKYFSTFSPFISQRIAKEVYPVGYNAFFHMDEENSFIEFNNTLFSTDSYKTRSIPVSGDIEVVAIHVDQENVELDSANLPFLLEPEGEAVRVNVEIEDKNLVAPLTGSITIAGDDTSYPFASEPYVKPAEVTPLESIRTPVLPHVYRFMKKDGNTLSIKKGSWHITRPLILPDGVSVKIAPGTTLTFHPNAFMLLRGPLLSQGTEAEPIILRGNDNGLWKGVAVMNAASVSEMTHTHIKNVSFTEQGAWKLTGGVTFYQSDINIRNSVFSGATSEDALNIVRSNFTIKDSIFSGAISDALDSDFSKGSIENSQFMDIGGDGIDTSGSEITLSQINLQNIADKAVSVGEESKVEISEIKINGADIGIASKDASTTKVNGVKIDNIKNTALMTYIKKLEYGHSASLTVNAITFGNVIAHESRRQLGTTLLINGMSVQEEELDIESIYEKK